MKRRAALPYEPPVALPDRIEEIRVGRNFIRKGDRVHVKPSRSGRRDGFEGRFLYAEVADGAIANVCVFGAPAGRTLVQRFFPLDRIERKAQTRGGERLGL
jgi:hypothetical protein